jgi:hypothetical protein
MKLFLTRLRRALVQTYIARQAARDRLFQIGGGHA